MWTARINYAVARGFFQIFCQQLRYKAVVAGSSIVRQRSLDFD